MTTSARVLCLFAILLFSSCRPKAESTHEGLRTLNGTELYVKHFGTGEPLVIVHGGPGLDHSYLLPHLADLARSHQLIFYDQRLSGRSAANVDSSGVTLANFVEDIEALRKEFGLEKFHLMGHSWGGLLTMLYAIEHSDRLESVTLVSTTAASNEYFANVNATLKERMSEADSLKRAQLMSSKALQEGDPESVRQFFKLIFRANFHNPEKLDELNLYVPPDIDQRSERLQLLMRDTADLNIYDRLGRISCPVLIVRGDYDALPVDAIERIHTAIPNSTLEIFEDCGHFPFIEQRERFIDTVLAFTKE